METKIVQKTNNIRFFNRHLLIGFLILFLSWSCVLTSTKDTGTKVVGGEQPELSAIETTLEVLHKQQTQISIDQTQIAATVINLAQVVSTDIPVENKITATIQATIELEEDVTDVENAFDEDFSEDTGRFSTAEGITIEDGALYMGKFEQCARFETDEPAGCISVCQACGDQLSEYEVNVEAVFVDGISERLYGLTLRFIDENNNQYIDQEDYFLGWVFSVNQAKWVLYEHKANDFSPWNRITSGDTNLQATPRKPNHLRVVSYKDGQRIDVYMNDTRMIRVVSTPPMPGEKLVEGMPDYGSIGFWVPDRGIRVMFDNYAFTDIPNED